MPAPKGNKNALGSKHSEATKIHYSAIRKGKPRSGNPENWKHSKTTKDKISQSLRGNDFAKGNVMSVVSRQKMSDARKGRKFKDEHKKAISKALKKLFEDPSNCPNWQGGLSFEPYSKEWTSQLKQLVRERDGFQCKICSKSQGSITFSVHHIDYNKKNCHPTNLITLCQSCHMKTNFNRNKWINYFHNLISLVK